MPSVRASPKGELAAGGLDRAPVVRQGRHLQRRRRLGQGAEGSCQQRGEGGPGQLPRMRQLTVSQLWHVSAKRGQHVSHAGSHCVWCMLQHAPTRGNSLTMSMHGSILTDRCFKVVNAAERNIGMHLAFASPKCSVQSTSGCTLHGAPKGALSSITQGCHMGSASSRSSHGIQ